MEETCQSNTLDWSSLVSVRNFTLVMEDDIPRFINNLLHVDEAD